MIDHVGVSVSDLARSRAFYQRALAPVGYEPLMDVEVAVGFGAEFPDFWIGADGPPGARSHVAFRAPDRATVDAFHAAALAAGGRDNGAPGLRAHYHENYYGAFVLDPDGHNVEVVCHKPGNMTDQKAF